MSDPSAPDYGLDAPGVVRNLFLAGGAGLVLALLNLLGVWSGRVVVGPIAGVKLVFPLASMGLWTGMVCTAMGLWMIWTSRVGKVRERDRLLDHILWTGHERVLDVGCGRGLMLIGAAKRLTNGKAIGVDIWKAEDLSGNRPESTLDNARREHVADRVEVQTADMRQLPFPKDTFDVIVSSAAIHNLYSAADRRKAIAEIARVLKPGGQAVIDDIRHHTEYAATFLEHGCGDVRAVSSRAGMFLLALLTMGSLRPATLLVRKAS
jgi:arsenite methyltransferase